MNQKREIQNKQNHAENAFRAGNSVLAEKLISEILVSDPGNPKANELLAYIFGNRNELDRALEHLKLATTSANASPESHYYLGAIYLKRKQYEAAIESLKRSLQLAGDFFEGLHDLGVAVAASNLPEDALVIFEKAASLNSESHELFYNIGKVFDELRRYADAMTAYRKALSINPKYAEAWYNNGKILSDLKRYDEALSCYKNAVSFKPENDYYYGSWLNTKMMLCDWNGLEDAFENLFRLIERGQKASSPFTVLATPATPALGKKCADIYIADKFPAQPVNDPSFKSERRSKIRIGYYSADFHNHATTYLIAGLFEQHDHSKFELVGFSFGPDRQHEMRKRVEASMSQFIDVRDRSDQEIAVLSQKMEIDIAVDLKGFTQDSRTGIFSHRAAPIQVNYLGYPGTMAASYIDYVIADTVVIDQEAMDFYSEKIAFLPHSYQANDRSRKIADKEFTRAEYGLPEKGFVFACFNLCYKITPDVFDVWMRLLHKVPGSVLWLFGDNHTAILNLQAEAGKRGVTKDRLIFAENMELEDHLARHRLADLFLDTFHYNAHTTASDALWAGLPVLTRIGNTFAGRVGASLLRSIGLDELIARSTEEYEALAYGLAIDPEKLNGIKAKLASNRATHPLFDASLFTRHMEAAYSSMYERHIAGLPPCHLYVEA